MDKLDKLLQDSLRKAGGDYHPSDPVGARQRFLASRRRRRLYGYVEVGTAVGMAALAVVFISRANLGSESIINTATDQPHVVATIETDSSPVAVAVGEGAVWMTDSDGGGIKKLDPVTNEEIDTIAPPGMGEPDEILVGAGSVWASNNDGQVFRIDPQTGAYEATPHLVPGDQVVHLDLALTESHLWALDPKTSILTKIGVASASDLGFVGTPDGFSDIATDGEEVWGYDAEAGRIAPAEGGGDGLDAPEGDENADLALGFGAAWISTGADGMVHRIDLQTGDQLEAEIGGRYADLSVDITESAVWALAIDDGANRSTLFELDPVTAEIVSEPVELPGVARDVSVGEGSVWVPDSNGEVRRISSQAGPLPTPTESAGAVTELPTDELLFVFVRDDDLWARYPDGTERLTDTPEIESAPTVSADGSTIAFVRRVMSDGRPDIVELEVATGAETVVVDGGIEPAYGPNGELAWVVPAQGILPSNGAIAQEPHISFRIGDRGPQSFKVFDVVQVPDRMVTELAWDQTATKLYIEVLYEGRSVHSIDVEIDEDGKVQMSGAEIITPHDYDAGGVYQAPSGPIAPLVVHSCCVKVEGDVATSFDLGQAWYHEGQNFESVADLSPLHITEGMELQTAYLGNVMLEDLGFVIAEQPSYLILAGDTLWLADSDNDLSELETAVTDVAAPFRSI